MSLLRRMFLIRLIFLRKYINEIIRQANKLNLNSKG